MLIDTLQSVAEHVESGGLRVDELELYLNMFNELLSLWHVTGNDRTLSVTLTQKIMKALTRIRQRWMDLQCRRLKPSEIRDQWPPPQSASTRATELDARIQLAIHLATSFRKSHSSFEFKSAYQSLCRGPLTTKINKADHSINQWSNKRPTTTPKSTPHRGIEFTNHTADSESCNVTVDDISTVAEKDTIRLVYNRMATSVSNLQKTLIGRVLLENLQLANTDPLISGSAKHHQCSWNYPNSFCQIITEFKTTLELVSGSLEDVRAYQPILKESWRNVDRKVIMVLTMLNCLHGVNDYYCHLLYKMATLYCHTLLSISTRFEDMMQIMTAIGSSRLKSLALKLVDIPSIDPDPSRPLSFLHRGNKFYDLDRQENQRITLAQTIQGSVHKASIEVGDRLGAAIDRTSEQQLMGATGKITVTEKWLGTSVFAPEGIVDEGQSPEPASYITEWIDVAAADENMMLMTPVLYSKVLALLTRCEDKLEFYAVMCLSEAHLDLRAPRENSSDDELLDLMLTGNQWMQKRIGCGLNTLKALDFWWALMNCRTSASGKFEGKATNSSDSRLAANNDNSKAAESKNELLLRRLMRAVAICFGDVCLQYSEGFVLLTDHLPDTKIYSPTYLQWVRQTKEMTTVKLSQLRVKGLLNEYQNFLHEMKAAVADQIAAGYRSSPRQSPGVIKRYLASRDEMMVNQLPQIEALIDRKIDERLARVESRAEDAVNSALEDLKDLSDSAAKLLKQFELNPSQQATANRRR